MAESAVIQIKTIEAVESIQDLKNNIKQLKADLNDLEIGSEEYQGTLKELQVNQNALRNAMYGTTASLKDITDAAKGSNIEFDENNKLVKDSTVSYNALVAKMAELKQEWRATTDEMTRTELGEQINSINDALKEMDASTGSFVRNVGNYQSALEGFGSTVKQIGGDMNQGLGGTVALMGMMGLSTDGANKAMKGLRVTTQILAGTKGLGLLIKNGKQWIASLKQQQALTTANATATKGLAAAETTAAAATTSATGAQIGLNTAMNANPILAIISLVLGLIAVIASCTDWFQKLGKAIGITNTEEKALKSTADRLNENFENRNKILDRRLKIMEAEGASNMELLEQKKKMIVQELNEAKAIKAETEMRIRQLQADSAWVRFWTGAGRKIKAAEEALEGINGIIEQLEDNLADINVDIKVEGIRAGQKATTSASRAADEAALALERYKKALEDSEKKVTELLKAGKSEYDLINRDIIETDKLVNDVYRQRIAEILKEIERQKELLKNRHHRAEAEQRILELEAEQKELSDKIEDNYSIILDYYEKTKILALQLKEYNAAIARDSAKIAGNVASEFATQQKRALLLKEVLGYSDEQVHNAGQTLTDEEARFKILEKEYETYKNLGRVLDNVTWFDVEGFDEVPEKLEDILKLMYGATLDEARNLFKMDPYKFAESFNEPLRTALQDMFAIEDEMNELASKHYINLAKDMLSEIDGLIGSGKLQEAAWKIDEYMYRMAEGDLSATLEPIKQEIVQKLTEMQGDIYNEIVSSDNPLMALLAGRGNFIQDIWEHSNDLIDSSKRFIAEWRLEMEGLEEGSMKYIELQQKINQEETRIHLLRMKRWEEVHKHMQNYFDTYGAAASSLATNVADLWKELLDGNENANKKAYEGVKTLQYSAAVVNGLAAVVQALADPTVPSYAVRLLNATSAGVAAAAQIAKIANTKYGDTSTDTTPSLTSQSSVQLTYGLNAEDYGAAATRNIKVYVTDKDLADGVNGYNNKKAEVTF